MCSLLCLPQVIVFLFENLTVDSNRNTITWGKHSRLHNQGGIYSWWIVKFDSDGIPVWHRGIGGAGNEYMTSQSNNITTDGAGSVYVVGYTDSAYGTNTSNYRGYLLKYHPTTGNLSFKKHLYLAQLVMPALNPFYDSSLPLFLLQQSKLRVRYHRNLQYFSVLV